jgi:asparagine synthase (glutamine-hydrolysing)
MNGIIFSSSVKSLIEHPSIKEKLKIDYDSINQYLTLNYLLFEKTFFKNIKQLQPGCYINFSKNKSINKIKEHKYWFLEKIFNKKRNKNITFEQAKEEMLFLVNNSIKLRINSDVKIGTYLSGGLDSSLISLQLKKLNNHNMLAHNISFKENSYDESFYARYLARKMDFNLKVHLMPKPKTVAIDFSDIVSAMDQPMADTAFISNFYLAKLSSKYSKVVLSGDGVDEMLCGYETYVADIIKNYSDLFPKFLINMAKFFFSNLTNANTEKVNLNYKIKKFFENNSQDYRHAHILWRSIFNQEEKNKIIKNNLLTNNFFNKILKNYSKVRNCHFLDQHMYIDLITWFPNDILYKIDRTTMFHSQEGRIPFLDTKVLEFCCSLPINLKIKIFQKKFILKKILSEKISHFFVNRKKSGFNSPVGSWIKNDKNFKEMTFSLLTTDNMSSFFDKKQLLELFTRHVKNIEDNTYKIFTLIVLSQWIKSNNIKI